MVGAQDGEHAMRLVSAGVRPDVVVVDFTLPRMSGKELLAWLSGASAYPGVPALVVTGRADIRAVTGARAVFQKPYAFEEMLNALRRALEATR